jgi:hypothetical protein
MKLEKFSLAMEKIGNHIILEDKMPFSIVEDEQPMQEKQNIGAYLKNIGSEALRHTARTGSRVAEQVVGFPGDVFNLTNEFVAGPIASKITGQKQVPYEKTLIGKALPTTEQHRKNIKSKTGQYLEPQNKVESLIDDFVSDATSLAIPGSKAATVGKKLAKHGGMALLQSLAGNVLGGTISNFSGDEDKGDYAKLGTFFAYSLINKKSAQKHLSDLYKPLEEKVSKLKPVSSGELESTLNNLKNKVSKGTLAPSEKFIVDEVDSILSKVKSGTIAPEELWATKRSINEKLINTLYSTPEKAAQGRARHLAKGIQKALDKSLSQTKKQDPKFYKELKSVNQAFGTLAQSNILSKFVEKNLKYTPVTHGIVDLLRGPVGGTIAGAAIPYSAGKVLYRISKSPTVLGKHYARTLKAASNENAVVFNKELKKFDQAMQKEEKKSKYSLIED